MDTQTLPRFVETLAQQPDAYPMLVWRYRNGRYPKILCYIAERPELAEALLQDALARKEAADTTRSTTHEAEVGR